MLCRATVHSLLASFERSVCLNIHFSLVRVILLVPSISPRAILCFKHVGVAILPMKVVFHRNLVLFGG